MKNKLTFIIIAFLVTGFYLRLPAFKLFVSSFFQNLSPPLIVSTVPVNGSSRVLLNTKLLITFNKPLAAESYIRSLAMLDKSENQTFFPTYKFYLNQNYVLSVDNAFIRCGGKYLLSIETLYQRKQIEFSSQNCNWISRTMPEDNQKNIGLDTDIKIFFDRNIHQNLPYGDYFSLMDESGQSLTFSFEVDSNVIDLKPLRPLRGSSKYIVSISSGLYKLLNNALTSRESDYNFAFITRLHPAGNVDFYDFQSVEEFLRNYRWYVATSVIGQSVKGKNIYLVTFGTGQKKTLIIGGHHGYEPESVWLPLELINYLVANPNFIPSNLEIMIIPLLNPDGFDKLARGNAHGVDLDRNYDNPLWSPSIKDIFYTGEKPFSEPETEAVKSIFENNKFNLVIAYHSIQGWISTNSFLNKYNNLNTILSETARQQGYDFLDPSKISEDKGIIGDFVVWADIYYHIPGVTIELQKESSAASLQKNLPILKVLLNWVSLR